MSPNTRDIALHDMVLRPKKYFCLPRVGVAMINLTLEVVADDGTVLRHTTWAIGHSPKAALRNFSQSYPQAKIVESVAVTVPNPKAAVPVKNLGRPRLRATPPPIPTEDLREVA